MQATAIIDLSQQFSKQLKVASAKFLAGQAVNKAALEAHLPQLATVPLAALTTDTHKKAFWINIYNGLTNLLIVQLGIQGSMKAVEGVYSRYTFIIGQYQWALDDIEHGLLRRNARPRLEKNDPRHALMVQQLDHRIHFALNCGARSCPPIAYYTAEQLDQQLHLAEQSFAEQEFVVNHQLKTISCSALFDWYRADFGAHYLNNPAYAGYTVTLRPYNWHTR